jgi:hypothetical protein
MLLRNVVSAENVMFSLKLLIYDFYWKIFLLKAVKRFKIQLCPMWAKQLFLVKHAVLSISLKRGLHAPLVKPINYFKMYFKIDPATFKHAAISYTTRNTTAPYNQKYFAGKHSKKQTNDLTSVINTVYLQTKHLENLNPTDACAATAKNKQCHSLEKSRTASHTKLVNRLHTAFSAAALYLSNNYHRIQLIGIFNLRYISHITC